MRVLRLKETYPTAKVELWCEDEHRLGLKPIIRKVWSPIGERPLVNPTHRQRASVLLGAGELRQGGRSGKEETHPARARSSRMAHGKEETEGPRRDTPGVPALAFTGAATLRKAVALEQRRGCEPPLREDRGAGGNT